MSREPHSHNKKGGKTILWSSPEIGNLGQIDLRDLGIPFFRNYINTPVGEVREEKSQCRQQREKLAKHCSGVCWGFYLA